MCLLYILVESELLDLSGTRKIFLSLGGGSISTPSPSPQSFFSCPGVRIRNLPLALRKPRKIVVFDINLTRPRTNIKILRFRIRRCILRIYTGEHTDRSRGKKKIIIIKKNGRIVRYSLRRDCRYPLP